MTPNPDGGDVSEINEAIALFGRAGWRALETSSMPASGGPAIWRVTASSTRPGENQIHAEGWTRAEAWGAARDQARSLGMLWDRCRFWPRMGRG